MEDLPAHFEEHAIRRFYDEETETWWFSVVDIVQVLTEQPNPTTARKYWNKLKERLKKEGSQLVTNCHQLKLTAADGKQRLTDAATAETLLRLVQSVPSPKAEPIKLWLAKRTSLDLESKTGKSVVTGANFLPPPGSALGKNTSKKLG